MRGTFFQDRDGKMEDAMVTNDKASNNLVDNRTPVRWKGRSYIRYLGKDYSFG